MNTHPIDTKLIARTTIITGDVNTGKTTLTGKLAERICTGLQHPAILVLDMAPTIPENVQSGTISERISGFVTFASMHKALVLKSGLVPPRLMGTSPSHTVELAEQNRKKIDAWIKRIVTHPPFDLLVINDLSIYLQAGACHGLEPLWCMASTVIANGYMGGSLGKGRLSAHEQAEMRTVCEHFHQRIHLEKAWWEASRE